MQSQEAQIATLSSLLESSSAIQAKIAKQPTTRGSQWFGTFESVIAQTLQENTTGLIVQTNGGFAHVAFPWELQHSPRIRFRHQTANATLRWRMRSWQFRHSNGLSANGTNGLISPSNVRTVGFLVEDGDITLGLESIEIGQFTSSIRTDVIDWQWQRQIARPLDLCAGLRYAQVAQQYVAGTDAGNASSSSSLRGIGPTVVMSQRHTLALNRLP